MRLLRQPPLLASIALLVAAIAVAARRDAAPVAPSDPPPVAAAPALPPSAVPPLPPPPASSEGARPLPHCPPPPPPVGGVVSGLGRDRARVFHHTELTLLRQVDPAYPPAALAAGLGDARCLVRVAIDARGVPLDVSAAGCEAPFALAAAEAVRAWRWAPPVDGSCVLPRAETTVVVRFRRSGG